MKTIAIISQKGGAGKTTLAVHLAVAAESTRKSAAIIDLDPQGSAASWKDLRDGDTPAVVPATVSRLAQVLETAAKHGAALAIIDTAPHSESAALAAARAADLILIPCRPAIFDLKAISTTVDLAKLAGKPACVVFNAVQPRGSLADEASTAVESYQIEIAPVRIAQRAAYVHALTVGQVAQEYEPEGKAAEEIKHLYKWTCKQVGL
jgi:chromosome partitioning protein